MAASFGTYTKVNNAQLTAFRKGPNGPVFRRVEAIGRRISQIAVRTSPVDTGAMKNSVSQEMLVSGEAVVTRVSTNVEYARFVHEGYTARNGRRVAGRPFLRNALEQAIKDF
jgi:hypothetical protein